MELVFLDRLKEISGYQDRRSIQAWLAREFRLPLLKIGKNYGVDKALFEQRFNNRYAPSKKQNKYAPLQQTEQAFLNEITDLLSQRT